MPVRQIIKRSFFAARRHPIDFQDFADLSGGGIPLYINFLRKNISDIQKKEIILYLKTKVISAIVSCNIPEISILATFVPPAPGGFHRTFLSGGF